MWGSPGSTEMKTHPLFSGALRERAPPAYPPTPTLQFGCSPPLDLSVPLPGVAVPVDEGRCKQEVQVLVDCGHWDGAWKENCA